MSLNLNTLLRAASSPRRLHCGTQPVRYSCMACVERKRTQRSGGQWPRGLVWAARCSQSLVRSGGLSAGALAWELLHHSKASAPVGWSMHHLPSSAYSSHSSAPRFLSFLRSSNSYFRAWGRRANDSGWLREVPTPPSGLTTAMRTTTLDCRGLCVKGARLGAEPAGIQSARRSSIGPTTIVRWIDSAKPQRRDPKACFARLKLTQDRVGIKRDKQELPPMARP